jgi:hypothetical protein
MGLDVTDVFEIPLGYKGDADPSTISSASGLYTDAILFVVAVNVGEVDNGRAVALGEALSATGDKGLLIIWGSVG